MPSLPPPATVPPPADHRPATPDAPPGPAGEGPPPWGTWVAPAAIALGFTLGVVGTLFVGIAGSVGGGSLAHPTPAVTLISDTVFDLAFVAAALYLASLHGRPRPVDFGFRRVPVLLAAKAILIGGFSYYALTAVYASLLHLHGSDRLPNELGVNKSTAALAAAAVFVCVIAPIAEEFFFRGFFFGALKRWQGPWVAAVLTGMLFGLAHTGSASSQYLIPLGFLGFVLCIVRWRTGSLYPCMALHSINNALALGINQLHWNLLEIFALILAANALIAAATWPLARRRTDVIVS